MAHETQRALRPRDKGLHPGQVGSGCGGGPLGPSYPFRKVITQIQRLSTLPPTEAWMFKIQFVKGKPLKYNTIFVSLFGFFLIYRKPKDNESGPDLSHSWQIGRIGLRF